MTGTVAKAGPRSENLTHETLGHDVSSSTILQTTWRYVDLEKCVPHARLLEVVEPSRALVLVFHIRIIPVPLRISKVLKLVQDTLLVDAPTQNIASCGFEFFNVHLQPHPTRE